MNRHKLLAELLISKAQNMPDGIKKAFVKRSVEDAKQIKTFIEKDGEVDLQKLAYAIYKAYTLGAALYDGDKLINLEINNLDEEEAQKKQYQTNMNNKVISINAFRKVSY